LKHSLVAEQKVVELVSFFKKLSSLDKSVLLSAEKGELNENLLAPFKSVSHAYFTVEMKTVAGTTSHFIVVNRFSNTENPVEDTIGFRVEPKVGIIIEITTIG
jgi:flagellar protein FlaH